jgi:rare lipoprotein A
MACRLTPERWPLLRPARWRWLGLFPIGLLALIIYGCAPQVASAPPAPAPPPVAYTPPPPPPPAPEHHETIVAKASWYGPGFDGHKTATGERFSSSKMTAAAKGLPLGSRVVVTNLSNGRSTTVRINDCGPHRKDRKIDLSKKAASKIGIIHDGTATVKVEVVKKPPDAPVCPPSI